MKTQLVRKFQRDGDWWGQRPDGSWLRWNSRRSDWEDYPLAPPGEAVGSPQGIDRAGELAARDSVVSDVGRVYGFLLLTAFVVALGGAGLLGLWEAADGLFGLPGNPPPLKHLALEAPGFILIWITYVGAAAVLLRRMARALWVPAMLSLTLLAAAGITYTHWMLEPEWVELSQWDVVKGWGVLSALGLMWRKFEFERRSSIG